MSVETGAFNLPHTKMKVPVTSAGNNPRSGKPKHLSVLVFCIAIIEFLAVAASAYLASVAYNRVVLLRWPPVDRYIPAAIFIASLVLLASIGLRQFSSIQSQPRHRFLWNGTVAIALAFSFFLSTLFILKWADDYSRGTLFFQIIAVSATVLAGRAVTYAWLQSAIASDLIEARRAILITSNGRHRHVSSQLRESGIKIVGSFSLPMSMFTANFAASSAMPNIIETCRKLRPDDILILAPAHSLSKIIQFADALSELPVSLHIIPVGADDLLATSRLGNLGNLTTIQVLHPPLSLLEKSIKRLFDITAASIGLIILSPLLLMVAIAIKLDSKGPIFFRQTRHGYNNDRIRVFKFRSMTVMEDGTAFKQVIKKDTRVTRVGRLLRRTNIDELPQLLNVLFGEMSIVGPRPHPTALNEMFAEKIPPLSRRHNVKPGITGWAQVNGCRGETDTLEKMQRRIEHDLYYIDNWSFLLDLKILLLTFFSKKSYANAY